MVLKQKEIKAVYLGETKVRPPFKPRTFTISRTEQSNMSSGWTYSDDATGLTAGSGDFDDFFGYSAVLLNTSGVETAEMTQTGGVFTGAMTTLGNITSGDNVMIKFPVRGIKMSKSGSTVTLSITDEKNKDGYQYYAHSTGTLSNPGTPKDAFYLGAYKGYINSTTLKSWSGKTPAVSMTQSNFCTYAKNNGTGYNIEGFYQRMYINALYMMKYGNPNSQSVVGKGYTEASSAISTGNTNSQTSATYGSTSSGTTQCRLFGLEDRWGNVSEFIGGVYTNSSKVLYAMLTGWNGSISGGESTGTTVTQYSSYTCLSSVAGTNKAMLSPISTVNNSSMNTYYSDAAYVYASKLMAVGGACNHYGYAGNLYWEGRGASGGGAYHSQVGTRLIYLNGLT